MQENIETTNLIDEYVQDVITRNDSMLAYRNVLLEKYKRLPLDEVKSQLKKVMEEDRVYRGFGDDERNSANDFELFEKQLPVTIVQLHFGDKQEVKNIMQCYMDEKNYVQSSNTLSDNAKKLKMNIIEIRLNDSLRDVYKNNLSEIKEKGYEKDYCSWVLSGKEAEFENRRIVQQEFNANKSNNEIMVFDEELDKGCCTKSLTVSLYKLQEKYGLDIFGKLDDVEDVAHPKAITQKLNKYMKSSETGNVEDIKMKRGDIVFLTSSDGSPRHAMLCYDFDKDTNEPLLLGFSSIQNKVKSYKNGKGESRTGVVLDVNTLIRDAQQSKEKTNHVQQHFVSRDR